MERCTYITIGEKTYPMRMTLLAREEIHKKYGSINGMLDAFKKESTCVSAYLDVAHLLIVQGCEYKNIFEKDIPQSKDAPIENGKYVPLSREELGLGMDGRDVSELVSKISEASGLSKANEIRGTSVVKKNEETE